MKIINAALAICLICAAGPTAFAETEQADDSAYESQLQGYTAVYGELKSGMMAKREKANEEQRGRNEKIKKIEAQLEQEYDNLVTGVETKEDSISRLRDLNTKLKTAQEEMYGQYSELEGLFQKQKEENSLLKNELETSKTDFYNKMLEFYEEEHVMLGEKISTLQERYNEVEAKIEMMKENLQDISQ